MTANDHSHGQRPRSRSPHSRFLLLAAAGLLALVLAGLFVLPNLTDSTPEGGREFVIPAGASLSLDLPTIDSAIAVPTEIVFEDGETAAISIRNDDSVANRAGPWVIGAGQTYTIAFDQPGEYEYICSVDAAESVRVTVR